MNISTGNAVNQSGLSLNGNCGYRIQGDRILVTIDRIQSDRTYENLSGTLSLAIQAFSFNDTFSNGLTLASTTIGEVKGQHILPDCAYDLIFQEPPAGDWALTLSLSEWNGTDYSLCDIVYFNVPYHVEVASKNTNTCIETEADTIKTELKSDQPKQQKDPITLPESKACDFKQINRVKLERLAKIKGVSLKVAERVVAQRPYHSMKALLSVKGMGPKTLYKILDELKK